MSGAEPAATLVKAAAWLVIAADGFRALFLDQARAESYAATTHGTVHPLYTLEAFTPCADPA